MPGVARQGDITSCGASLISGASKTYCNGRLIERLGDANSHGDVIISSSSTVTVEGSLVARLGDNTSCPRDGHGVNPIASASSDTFVGS